MVGGLKILQCRIVKAAVVGSLSSSTFTCNRTAGLSEHACCDNNGLASTYSDYDIQLGPADRLLLRRSNCYDNVYSRAILFQESNH